MPSIPEVKHILEQALAIHEKKNEDYASPGKSYENFERSAVIASWFDNPVDKAFAVLIGTKLSRIATLRNSSKPPNNESLADSFLDLTTYSALFGGYVEAISRYVSTVTASDDLIDETHKSVLPGLRMK